MEKLKLYKTRVELFIDRFAIEPGNYKKYTERIRKLDHSNLKVTDNKDKKSATHILTLLPTETKSGWFASVFLDSNWHLRVNPETLKYETKL